MRWQSYLLVYTCIAVFLVLLHEPLLQLPYYWDEIGQFIPASLDLFQNGSLIPHSTLPNVHPPGVMAYLAIFWHLFGCSIAATRVAMLLLAAAGALFSFLLAIELSRGVPGTPAFAATVFLAASPLFFAQAMLAQLDMPALCFTTLALLLFLQDRYRDAALACIALVLVKETGIVAPLLFGGWLIAERRIKQALWFLLPLAALVIWLIILKRGTGHWFGNQAFTQYNLYYPLNPIRFGLAILRRLYFLFIGTGHFIGTLVFIWAFRRMPVFKNRAWRITGALLALHTVAVTALGGAVLERYLLPVLPIVFIAFAISFHALRHQRRQWVIATLLACLIAANFINPIYPFPFENNLAFVSFVGVQSDAVASAAVRPGTIATAFPVADAFRRPEFGFVLQNRPVMQMQGFRAADIAALAQSPPDAMIVYDTTWDPLHLLTKPAVQQIMRNWYGYDPPLAPEEIARRLSMRVSHTWQKHGISMSLLTR